LKKTMVIGIIVGFMLGFMGAGEVFAGDYFFREANIGSTRSDIRAREAMQTVSAADNHLGYEVRIEGYNFYAVYYFDEQDSFRQGSYMLADNFWSTSRYIQAYDLFKGILTEVYGHPESDSKHWLTEDGQPKRSWTDSEALSANLLSYYTEWRIDDDLTILMSLSAGPSSSISLRIDYYNEEEMAQLLEQDRQKSKSNF